MQLLNNFVDLFYPAKGTARMRTIIWGAVALAVPFACSAFGANDWGCYFFLALFVAAVYAFAWYRRSDRDKRLTTTAQRLRYTPVSDSDGYGTRAPKTTPGSEYIGLDSFGPPESV